tara:strand:+ start:116 stop:622 length:507 start_codon:yes stop_codon:yes gene_type:complete
MLSFKKNLVGIILLSFLITSCGYKPFSETSLTGPNIVGMGKFDLFLPKDEIDFAMKKELLKDLGFPEQPTHRILVDNDITSIKGLITRENAITRYNLVLRTTFKLVSLPQNELIFKKVIISQTAYSASKNVTGFATKTAKDSAKERLAKDVAKKITMELLMLNSELRN